MARRKDDSIIESLVLVPWWVSIVVSVSCYIALVYVFPILAGDSVVLNGFATGLSQVAYIIALVLLLPAPLSYWNHRRKRRLLDIQKDPDSIRLLSWREFEELLGEAFRRKGYSVIENPGPGPDGGIDIRLHKDGRTYLVQCKHWKFRKVGVSVVREFLGVIKAEDAAGGLIVTSGSFSEEAKKFSLNQAVDLIDGSQLYHLISSVQNTRLARATERSTRTQGEPTRDSKNCPSCGSGLVMRISRKGKNPGSSFYGCTSFPKCRYTETTWK